MRQVDVAIIGAGAAGMMCAAVAGRRGRSVIVLDHADAPGKKIRISGGGRCNFTNIHTEPGAFLSANPRFAISALKRYRPHDFVALIEKHGIAYHEKTLGQLFCDGSAQEVIDMLVGEMKAVGATLELGQTIETLERVDGRFRITTSSGPILASAVVVASGGKSIPKMGATGLAYRLAEQFGLSVTETRPALVPLTFEPGLLEKTQPLSGIGIDAIVAQGKTRFREGFLFTHRGLSGPSILQISSYWREGQAIEVNFLPDIVFDEWIARLRANSGSDSVISALSALLPRRLAEFIVTGSGVSGRVADLTKAHIEALKGHVTRWTTKPVGSEGFRTAEVTLGGVSTSDLNSSTMEAKSVPGLYFIGEAVDVTGWLGGYNFQWAWSSGWCAGQVV